MKDCALANCREIAQSALIKLIYFYLPAPNGMWIKIVDKLEPENGTVFMDLSVN